MSTWYVDLNHGNDSDNGTSFAQRVLTLTRAAALAAAGDTIRIMGNASTSSGTASWTNGSPLVTLSSSLTQLLYADGAWTAGSTKVTCSTTTGQKQGANCASMACSSTFTTGKVAYFATGTLDLAAYQQVSFWVQSSVALAANALSIDLCSDTAGATIVDTLTLDVALNAGTWTNVTIKNSAALGSSIKSINLTAHSSLASTTIYIDNVLACNAPTAAGCLTLSTLISLDNLTWYHIQSIDGVTIYVDAQETTAATDAPGFQGSTVSGATFYMLQPTQVTILASGMFAQTFSKDGSSGNQITISGGWDSTAMTTQSGWTTIDLMDWSASGVEVTGTVGYLTFDHFNFVRCAYPIFWENYTETQGYVLSNSTWAGVSPSPYQPYGGMTIATCNFLNCATYSSYALFQLTAGLSGAVCSITNSQFFGCAGFDSGNAVYILEFTNATITGCNASGCQGLSAHYGTGFQIIYCGGTFSNNTANNNTNGGFVVSNSTGTFNSNTANNNTGDGFQILYPLGTINSNTANNNTQAGFAISNITIQGGTFIGNTANDNANGGFNFTSVGYLIAYNMTALGNTGGGITVGSQFYAGSSLEIYGLNTDTSGGSSQPQIAFSGNGKIVVYNWTQYTGSSPAAELCSITAESTAAVYSQTENGVAADNTVYTSYGNSTTTGITDETGSNIAWQLTPNTSATTSALPLRLNVGRVACPANDTTYVTYWAKLSAVSGISAQFHIYGGRYPGVGSIGVDTIVPVSGTSWAQYTITITPTANCVVDIFFEGWQASGGTATVSTPSISAASQPDLLFEYGASPFILQTFADPSSLDLVYQATPFLVPTTVPGATYTLDSLGRLTNVAFSNGYSIGYSYDKVGNRTQVVVTS